MPDPLPYNVTLSSQTGSISYYPAREGTIDAGWNSSYSAGTRNTGYGRDQGLGADSHRTSRSGASMEFSWVGTAIYLYGKAAAGSYSILVDSQDIGVAKDKEVPQGGLLGSKDGLQYGNHTVKLLALGSGEVGFQYAQTTIGVGYSNTTVQNRTIMTVDEQPGRPQANSFFHFDVTPDANSWRPEDIRKTFFVNGSSTDVPRHMITTLVGDKVTFTVSRASAFFLYGSMNYDHGPKQALIYSSKDGEANARQSNVDDTSNYLDFQQIIYWQSGLEPSENYTVQLTNVKGAFAINRLEIIDGGFESMNTSSEQKGIGAGAIAGVVVGCFAALALFVVGFLFWKHHRSRRRQRDEFDTRQKEVESLQVSPFTTHPTALSSQAPTGQPKHSDSASIVVLGYSPTQSQMPQTSLRATDAGPVHHPLLPPEYQNGWAEESTGSTHSLLAGVSHHPSQTGTESESASDISRLSNPFSAINAAPLPRKQRQSVGRTVLNRPSIDEAPSIGSDRKRRP